MAHEQHSQLPLTAQITRRQLLAGVLAGIAAAGVASACGGSAGGDSHDTPPPLKVGDAMFDSAGVRIHYTIAGAGHPIVLLHGWASNYQENWGDTGWEAALAPVRQIIGVDQRGHGASDKPHDPASYTPQVMAQDVINLLDYLSIEKADVFGYSMGGGVAGALIGDHEDRLRALVMGGIGTNLIDRGPQTISAVFGLMADALLAEDPSTITSAALRAIRDDYARKGNDLAALAAWLKTDHFAATLERLSAVSIPVLVANAEGDAEGAQVAAAISGAQFESIPDTNHLSVIPDQRYKDRILRFLREVDTG